MKELIVKILRPIWHDFIPVPVKKRLIPYINKVFQKRILRRAKQIVYKVGEQKSNVDFKTGPLTVSAFFGESLGIGRGGHCSFDAFERAGYNPTAHDLRPLLNTTEPFSHHLPEQAKGGVHFIHCNPPEVLALIRALHPDSYKNNYRIGFWAYELPKAPKEWIEVSHFFHEIWVPSAFVKSALAGAHCPIKVMPHDVLVSIAAVDPEKGKFSISNDKRTILLAGDLRSSATRKNLRGGLEVFKEAFPVAEATVELIIKLSETTADQAAFLELENIIANRPDIHLIKENLTYEDIISLINSCDVFLSPHRSEGFGLMLAEAIALEKVVLATGWSGNMEFMSCVPEALLPFELVPVEDPAKVYAQQSEQVWADIDIIKAGERLKATVYSKPDFQPARKRLQEISDMWNKSNLQNMPFSEWVETVSEKI